MNDRVFQAEAEVVSEMSARLAHYILPLFFDNEDGKPKRCGSGFLVSARTASYLISAAHVIDIVKDGREPYFYIGPKTKRKLSGSARLTRLPPGRSRLSDNIDVGVLKLEGPGLPPYPDVEKYPLQIEALRPGVLPRANKQYLLAGFPGTQTELNLAERQVTTKLYSYRNISHPADKYASICLDPQSHIAVIFDHKRALGPDGHLRKFPNLAEMSGSPLWLLNNHVGPNDPPQTPVVGIFIEHRKSHRAMIATDIGFALAYIHGAV